MVNPNEFNEMNDENLSGSEDALNEEQAVMPLVASDFGADDALTGFEEESGKKAVNGSAIIIVLVVIMAVGGLFLMRKFTQVTLASAQDATIEAFVNRFIEEQEKAGTNDADVAEEKVMAGLSQDRTERQVDPHDIQRDPFVILNGLEPPPNPVGPVPPTRDEIITQKQNQRRIEARSAAEMLELKSIMGGSRPLAIIDGQIYRPGETIAAGPNELVFRIVKIETGSVELVHEAPEIMMSTVSDNAVVVTLTLE